MEINERIKRKVKKGNRKVIMSLYKYVFDILMSTAVRYKRNKEEQMTIVNDAFMKIIDNIDKYKTGTSFLSWSKRIVLNVAIDDFRKNKKYKELFDYDQMEFPDEVDNEYEFNESIDAERINFLINKLPPKTKIVFNLYAIDELKIKEIAEELGISYETVKWHIKEARNFLRKELKKKTFEL